MSTQSNELQERVIAEKLDRKISTWKKIDSDDLPEFPVLSEEELTNLTIGVYQLKLAKSYTSEHLDDDGDYICMVNDEIEGILRARIQSRHISSKSYMLWISYSSVSVNSWYCQCRAGARVVGACAHVSSVLWYLGFARHSGTIKEVQDWSKYIEDAADLPQFQNDSSSDESDPEE